MITPRQNDILAVIVDLFTQTQEPVGSKALQEVIASSSATIRNDMARLEKLGLLEKAHTSSGRLPSKQGFQYFVTHCLKQEVLDEAAIYQVVKAFDFEAFRLEDILQKACQVLADLTGCTAMALDVEPQRQRLTSVDLVQLSSHDALAVLTLDESKPVTVQFAIPKNFLTKDLGVLKQLISDRFLGQTVLDIHYKLRTELPQVVQRYFTVTDNVLDLVDYLFEQVFEETILVAGKVAALTYGELETYQFLDNSRALAMTLRQTLSEDQTFQIHVGNHPDDFLKDLTLMTQQVVIPYRGMASLHLLGPIEMPYQRLTALLNLVSRVLELKLSDYYRYLSSNHYEVN